MLQLNNLKIPVSTFKKIFIYHKYRKASLLTTGSISRTPLFKIGKITKDRVLNFAANVNKQTGKDTFVEYSIEGRSIVSVDSYVHKEDIKKNI